MSSSYMGIRGVWEQEPPPTSLTLGCTKRLRPLAPNPATIIRSPTHTHLQVEAQPGPGTRWNPTQEQIAILEALYKSGMRTPTALQIEHIAKQLNKYGKVEGKNVFYWFQNHKARERQKQKRMTLALIPQTPPYSPCSGTNVASTCMELSSTVPQISLQGDCTNDASRGSKRKLLQWEFETEEDKVCNEGERVEYKTLKLFPLHPELSLRGF